ncbi:hypothetical protein GCM10007382_06090 [Salinibacterium xinjiangense]|nr:hypothetical protein GCM10007382_06090 [Salinibacterium xinjiangense]
MEASAPEALAPEALAPTAPIADETAAEVPVVDDRDPEISGSEIPDPEIPDPEMPLIHEPITDVLVIDEPVIDESDTDKPVTDKPVTDKPVTREPATRDTGTDELHAHEPSEQPAESIGDTLRTNEGPSATQAVLANASAWARRVGSASQARVTELRALLAAARVTRASKVAEAQAIAELARTSEDPDVETPAYSSTRTQVKIPENTSVEPSVEASAHTRKHDVVLSVTGLSKRFDDTIAVASIDLEVGAGDFYGIVGPNGAGKTTTLSMITGLLRPDSGSVIVHGTDVWSDPVAAKRHMGVLPDRLRLFDRLTGAQLLYYSGILRGLDAAVVRKRSADLAQAFGLEESMGRLVTDYSAGMTKKIALAAAMIHSPRMLVLDEPFESVDPVSAATVTEILKNYAAAGGTVVLSSHSMDMVQRMCDHVAVVVNGQILADGTIDEVRGGKSLEARFIELAGGVEVSEGLQWLHSFSN